MSESIAERLAAWLGAELGAELGAAGRLQIRDLRRTSFGVSRENWVFEADWTAGGTQHTGHFIARRDPVGSVLDTDRRTEFALLRALAPSGVPVPVARWLDADGARLGRPAIVMDLASGHCDYLVLNGKRPLVTRLDIARQLCDRLADIHRLDWRALGLGAILPDPGDQAALAALAHWEGELRRVQREPEPELELVLAWLRRNAPHNAATTLVHGDYKPGNVLLEGDRVSLVLDWETAHLGDPLEDIGWVTNPLRAGEQCIAGNWQPADLIAHWKARTGLTADPAAIRWWNVLANLKQCITVLTGIHTLADRRFDRLMHSPVLIYRLLLQLIEA